MNKHNAYWISPKGQTIDVPITHIDTILKSPKKFGLTKDYLVKKYEEYGERLGVEGEARGKIMLDLMKKGWVRVRYIPKNDSWTLQTHYFGNKEKNNVWDWVNDALKSKVANRYADLRILIVKSSRVINSSFAEASKGKKIFERLFRDLKLTEILNEVIDVVDMPYRMFYHNHLIENVFDDEIVESSENDEVLNIINKNALENVSAKEFYGSLYGGSKHPEMLTKYSASELGKMKLFKVPGYNIGYALKKWKDGKYSEIVAVHNNEKDIKGVGTPLMKSAIKNGGCFLDHFDGYLSNLYSKLGFVEYDRIKFDPKYVNKEFEKKYGKADVIYRVHKSCKNRLKRLQK